MNSDESLTVNAVKKKNLIELEKLKKLTFFKNRQ